MNEAELDREIKELEALLGQQLPRENQDSRISENIIDNIFGPITVPQQRQSPTIFSPGGLGF